MEVLLALFSWVGLVLITIFSTIGVVSSIGKDTSVYGWKPMSFLLIVACIISCICWFCCVCVGVRRCAIQEYTEGRIQIDTLSVNPKTGEVVDWDFHFINQ